MNDNDNNDFDDEIKGFPQAPSNSGPIGSGKTTQSTKKENRLKIAHRTRSKYHLGELTLAEIETDLPSENFLIDNNNTNSGNPGSIPDFLREYGNKSSSNLFESSHSNSASTPIGTVEDPQDDLWMEFLNSLQQPKNNSNNVTQTSVSSKLIDQDEADHDDPDFTLCLDNCDLEEPGYIDKWFQVPRREAILLVKDAIEFCDSDKVTSPSSKTNNKGIPASHLAIDNQRTSHHQANPNNEKSSKNIIPQSYEPPIQQILPINTMPVIHQNIPSSNQSNEYIPQFTDLQRRQLDEQLRNHVQLLTQTCLISYNVIENKDVFDEAKGLLDVLKDLTLSDTDMLKNSESTSQVIGILSNDFHIINLDDAIKITDELPRLGIEPVKYFEPKNGVPVKIIESFVKSPVFYNTGLLPNAKYKYVSTFKRSHFTDNEKILLILGYNKFKHLAKEECCQCVKEHTLPHRSCFDIRKQFSLVNNSDLRQISLKDLQKKQKDLNQSALKNFEFKKNVHYKSPAEQIHSSKSSQFGELAPMYTIAIERLRLGSILKDTKIQQISNIMKNSQKDPADIKKKNAKKKRGKDSDKNEGNKNQQDISNIENTFETPGLVMCLDTSDSNDVSVMGATEICCELDESINIQTNKKSRLMTDNDALNSTFTPAKKILPTEFSTNKKDYAENRKIINVNNNPNDDVSVIDKESTPIPIIQNQISREQINSFLNRSIAPGPIIASTPNTIFQQIGTPMINPINISNPTQMFQPQNQQSFQISSNGQIIPIPMQNTQFQPMQQLQQMQQQGLVIPHGFQGTIIFQPTIHMHTKKGLSNMNQFRKIVPKKS